MTYHNTKDNAGLHRFILTCVAGVKKGNGKGEFGRESAWGARGRKEAITIIVVSFLFYTSYFTGITILSYVLASQTQR